MNNRSTHRTSILALVVAGVSCLFACHSAPAQPYIVPVSRSLHVDASATDTGGTTHSNPADVLLTTESGTFSNSAQCTSPNGAVTGSASIDSTLNPTQTNVMRMFVNASLFQNFFDPNMGGGGSSRLKFVIDVPAPLVLHENTQFFGHGMNAGVSFSVRNQGTGALLVFESYPNDGSMLSRDLNFAAGRYEFDVNGIGAMSASGPGSESLLTTFTVVPEPCALGLLLVPLILSPRRAHRV